MLPGGSELVSTSFTSGYMSRDLPPVGLTNTDNQSFQVSLGKYIFQAKSVKNYTLVHVYIQTVGSY